MYLNGAHPQDVLKSAYYGIVYGKFSSPQSPKGKPSTSPQHKVAHKLYVEWLLNSNYNNGRKLGIVDTERPFGEGNRFYVADVVSYWHTMDGVVVEAVEVQNPMHYRYFVRYEGRKELHDILKRLKSEDAIDREQNEKIIKWLKGHYYRGSKRHNMKGRRTRTNDYFLFHTDKNVEDLSITDKIDKPFSEVERKYRRWKPYHQDGFFDELSFLVGFDDIDQFRADALRRSIPVTRFYTIDKELVKQVISMNRKSLHESLKPLKKPNDVCVEEMISIEAL